MMNWYTIHNIDTVDSPALVVYPDRVQRNIELAVRLAGGPDRLRPHVKTNKMAEVCRLLLQAGIRTFKCATIAEAEMLALLQAPDVLLAHQPAGPKIERLRQLVVRYPGTTFSCIIDNIETAQEIASVFAGSGIELPVYIDLNTGMNRSGIIPAKAVSLFTACLQLGGISITGLHAYDGHIRDTDLAVRKQRADEAFQSIDTLLLQLAKVSDKKLQVVVGGSPSFPTHIGRANVQLSPGTFVFWDWGYKHQVPDEPFDYAALVVTRIVSIIDDQTVCADLGHKAVAAENPLPRVHFLNAADATPTGQSEEHLVLKVPDAHAYKVGDVLYGVPVHICPTVALYDTAVVIENNKAAATWDVIARKRKINI